MTTLASEVLEMEERSRHVGWGEGRLRTNESSWSDSLCVRVLENGRQGLVTTTRADAGFLEKTIKQARDVARILPSDPHRSLAPPLEQPIQPIERDGTLFSRSSDDTIAWLADLEKKALARDSRLKKVIRLDWHEEHHGARLANSNGLRTETTGSAASFSLEVLAEQNGEAEAAWDYRSSRFASSIDVESVLNESVDHALASLGGRPIPSGNYDIVFHPRVGCQLLDVLDESFSAEAVQLGRSVFRDSLGKTVASTQVTILDDPLRPDGLASAAVDDEGIPAQRVVVMEDGVLRDFFYDLRTASRAGRKSNGHAVKAALSAPPRPGASNLFIARGPQAPQDLLSAAPKIFYVWDVMGLHMVDPITGEFSLGATGFLYESGKRVRPVRGVTLAGRLMDLLSQIKSVASDLTWIGSRGAPHILAGPLSVGGS